MGTGDSADLGRVFGPSRGGKISSAGRLAARNALPRRTFGNSSHGECAKTRQIEKIRRESCVCPSFSTVIPGPGPGYSPPARRPPCWASTSCCGSPCCEAPAAVLRSSGPQGRGGGRGARRRSSRRLGALGRRRGAAASGRPGRRSARRGRRLHRHRRSRSRYGRPAGRQVPGRAGERGRPAGSLRLHPAGDRRSRRRRGGDLDRRRLADAWPPPCAAASRRCCPSASATWRKLAATFRAQVNALIVDPARRRTFWRRLVEGPAARLVLAGDDAGARRTALGELDDARRRLAPVGIAHIVGAGPGDPDLLDAQGRAAPARGRRHPARRPRAAGGAGARAPRRRARRGGQAQRPGPLDAGRDQCRAGPPRARRPDGGAPEGGRSLRLRPWRRGSRGVARSGSSGRDRAGRHRRLGLRGVGRHSAHPSQARLGRHLRLGPQRRRQPRGRMAGAGGAGPHARHLHGRQRGRLRARSPAGRGRGSRDAGRHHRERHAARRTGVHRPSRRPGAARRLPYPRRRRPQPHHRRRGGRTGRRCPRQLSLAKVS